MRDGEIMLIKYTLDPFLKFLSNLSSLGGLI